MIETAGQSRLPDADAPTWPRLALEAWEDTYQTLHLWTQIVGKIRLSQCAPINHWWHVTLAVTSRGLTTGPMPYGTPAGESTAQTPQTQQTPQTFQIDFDFLAHELLIATSRGQRHTLPLIPRSVAEFYHELRKALGSLGIAVEIWTMPQEIPDPIPFDRDLKHAAYDPEYAQRFFRILVQVDRVCRAFRSPFLGKVSPVQFFWGSFDLAVTRFSGRRAPLHPGGGLLAD